MSEPQSPSSPSDAPASGRRAFLKVGTAAIGTGLASIVVAPALRAILWPLAADAGVISGGDEFIVVGPRRAFGKVPVKIDIFADRVDAWNRITNVKVGSAWVVERDGQLHAFSTVCPHLGCAVDFDAEANKFKCPCHDSAFGLDGSHEAGPSPRPLDALGVEEQQDGKLVAIHYERFKQGVEDKVKIG